MALVFNLRVIARRPRSSTWESTLRRLRATWLGRIQPSATTSTRYFLKDGFKARVAATSMAELLTEMFLARQQTPTHSRTNMFIFNIFSGNICSAPVRLTLDCSLLATAATGVALMPSTVQVGSTCSEAHWLLDLFPRDLLTSRLNCCPATLASYFHLLETWRTFLGMTGFLAEMSTRHLDSTDLLAMGNFCLARLSRFRHDLFEGRLAARAMCDCIR